MAGLGQRLLGAALAGAGTGIVQQAQARRQETLLKLKRQYQVEDRQAAADLTREGWERQDERAAESRAASEVLTREGWERADERAAEGRAHDVAMFERKTAAAVPKPTAEQQNIAAFLQRNPDKTEADYFAMKRAPGATVNVNQGPGKAPKGYRNVQMEDGTWGLEPIPGGPADIKAKAMEEKEAGRTESQQRQANLAITHIGSIRDIIEDSPFTTTGIPGQFMKSVGGTSAHDLDKRIDSLKAMIGFNALNEMRANSPTGGALGNVTERELGLLQSTVASLELSQSKDQFLENLALVEDQFNQVIHGPQAGGPERDASPLEPAPDVTLPPPASRGTGSRSRRPNPDGSVSSELSITVPDPRAPGKWINIPSMYEGREVSEDEALRRIRNAGYKDPETGRAINSFGSVGEAVSAAESRSDALPTTLPPPERVEPTSALTPLLNGGRALSASRATPDTPSPAPAAPVVNGGARNGGRNGGRKGPPQPEAPPGAEALSEDEAERVAMYAELPPDALQRQVETMAANPDQYSDAEKRAAAIAWERAFGGG